MGAFAQCAVFGGNFVELLDFPVEVVFGVGEVGPQLVYVVG